MIVVMNKNIYHDSIEAGFHVVTEVMNTGRNRYRVCPLNDRASPKTYVFETDNLDNLQQWLKVYTEAKNLIDKNGRDVARLVSQRYKGSW